MKMYPIQITREEAETLVRVLEDVGHTGATSFQMTPRDLDILLNTADYIKTEVEL